MSKKNNAAVSAPAAALVQEINERKRNTVYHGISQLSTALMQCLEPLVTAIDMNPNWVDDPSTDNGQERPSMGDVGLQIILSFTIQQWHTQTYGPIQTKKGVIDCVKDRLDAAEKAMMEHVAKYQDDPMALSTDPRTYTLNHYFNVAEARFNAYKDVLDSFKSTYQQVTGEVWKSQNERNPVKKVELTDQQKASANALMERFMKKSPSAPLTA